MDSFLSGREQLGQNPKKKETKQFGPEVLSELALPQNEDAEKSEVCGEGGSRVSYVSEEGRVTKIVVTCACGQVTEIDCNYEE